MQTRPKIAFVTSHPIQYQVPVFRQLEQMEDLDFQVLFAQIPSPATQGAEFGVAFKWDLPLLEGYSYKVLKNVSQKPSVMEYSGCDTPDIAQVLREGRFDAVVVNGWVVKTCLQTLSACRKLRIPCLVRGEANLLRPRPLWKQWIQGLLVRRYDGFLYIGEENRRFYKYYGIKDSQLFPAKYCIENNRFSNGANAVDRDTLRRRWMIPEESTCFLFCGKFIDKKHPLELIEAFSNAIKISPQLHLLMVGDGLLKQEAERIISERQLPITLTGFLNQQEIIGAYSATDCLVVPSDFGETWGLVVNEGMACGLPAIVSDQVGCRIDLVERGVTGDWFPFGEWQHLSRCMVNIAANRSSLRAMGQNAQSRIMDYSPELAAEGVRQAVLATLNRRR